MRVMRREVPMVGGVLRLYMLLVHHPMQRTHSTKIRPLQYCSLDLNAWLLLLVYSMDAPVTIEVLRYTVFWRKIFLHDGFSLTLSAPQSRHEGRIIWK